MEPTHLDLEDVIAVASVLGLSDDAFIVGGQASNLWAERYATRAEELWDYGPFTSKDVDYYGHRKAATKLANAFNGKVLFPNLDQSTVNSAVVEVTVNGKLIVIDFIHSVLGVKSRDLRASELVVRARLPDRTTLIIPILHPIACLKSRVANVLNPALRRTDAVALRQLQAAPIVVREYILEALEAGDFREAQTCLRALFEYLRSDEYGQRVHRDLQIDLLEIIRGFATHPRLDERFREHNVQTMLRVIEERRSHGQ